MDTSTYDVAVVGGGAAGLSAALVLGRARRRVVLIDAGEPRNAPASHMHGYLSQDGLAPAELLRLGRVEAAGYGVEFIADRVVSAEPAFSLRLGGGGRIEARRLLIATGATDDLPPIEGVRERWGKDFLHCPYCHGWEVRDEPLGLLATGSGSVEHAELIRQWSTDLIFFTHTRWLTDDERRRLETLGIRIVESEVRMLVVEGDRLRGVALADGSVIDRSAVFIRPNMRPNATALLEQLGCDMNDSGFVRVDEAGRTSVSGVWAAGNVANPRAQVITAAGEGSAAAIAINADLVHEDAQRARDETGRDDYHLTLSRCRS
jgi:thioredoxin reductase